jgi:steroid 5-alpha reductase family enzyme
LTLLAVPFAARFFGAPLDTPARVALESLLYVLLAAWLACFLLAEWSGNASQVDRLWSILPVVYTWLVAWHGGFPPRLLLMALLVTAWGARLTYNFSRHGGYRLRFWAGHEDYRWSVLRAKPGFQPAWKWRLFNFAFISGYQNALLLLLTLPALIALQYAQTPLRWLDYLAAALICALIVFETVADNQQWRYQTAKQARLRAGETLTGDCAKGFLDRGLWAYSRHPNYFAEQSIWVAFYGFAVAASGQWLNWSIAGCLLLILLFRGSSALSESISAEKYPEYAAYQRRVPRFVPWGLFTGKAP